MSAVGGLSGNAASYYAQALQQLEQRLFSKIDANGDGSVTKSELEQAVSKAGGTTASADALYAALDPNNTGSVSAQQFAQNLPLPVFSPEMGAQLITAQAQTSGTGSDPAASFKADLFTKLTNGNGTLTKSELEQAVTAAGGTTASADALYAKLDPNNTGSVSEQQFIQNLPGPHHHHHAADASTSGTASGTTTGTDDGSSAQDALMALIDSLMQPAGTSTAGTTGDTSSQTSDGSSSGSTTAAATSGATNNSAETALLDLLNSLDPSSQAAVAGTSATSTTGTSADDALMALLNADGTGASTTTGTTATTSSTSSSTSSDSSPASLFAKFNQQILALMMQLQTQSFAA